MTGGRRTLLAAALALLPPGVVAAADRPASIRVGNLANRGELTRFERRVWEGCGREADIRIERQASTRPEGRVVGQYPPRGTRIGCDAARAILYVSAGAAETRLYVPALVEPAQRRAFARQLRAACRAPVAIAEIRRPWPLPPGRFVDQSPEQGQPYRCGTPIEVRLSAGPRGEALTAPAATASAPRKSPRPAAEPRRAAERPSAPHVPQSAPPEPPALQPAAPQPTAEPAPPVTAPAATAPAAAPAPALEVETIPPQDMSAGPAAPRFKLLGFSLSLLLLAVWLVALMLRRLAPAPRRAPSAARRPDRAPQPPATPPLPLAPLLALDRGWPAAEARLLPPARVPPGPPVDALPPVPLLRDFLRPLDPVLHWIADTPLEALADPSAPPAEGAETLAPLQPAIAEALAFALLFELPPLLARAWANAPELPLHPAGPSRGWCALAPHSIAVHVTPDLTLTAAGVPLARPQLRLRLSFTFPQARLFLRGTALDAIEPGPVHTTAEIDWAGDTRPLAVLRPHAAWPGQLAVTPPLQVQACTDQEVQAPSHRQLRATG